MEDRGEVLYELSPKFDFIYELTMPSGKKMKGAFRTLLITLVIRIVIFLLKGTIMEINKPVVSEIFSVTSIVFTIALIVAIIAFAVRVAIQIAEYKGIKYKFYKNCLMVENNFLNQTKKTIEYTNIKEVEIRRNITDRLLNYGIIIIYTNADKSSGSATVIYAIKNAQEVYNNIESLIHNGNIISSPIKSSNGNHNAEIELQNAMNRNETYSDIEATSDVNPLNKNN